MIWQEHIIGSNVTGNSIYSLVHLHSPIISVFWLCELLIKNNGHKQHNNIRFAYTDMLSVYSGQCRPVSTSSGEYTLAF